MSTFSSWSEFFRVVFGEPYMVWHDGPDFRRLHEEANRDRAGTIQMLLVGLRQGDVIAPDALAELQAVEAIPALKQALGAGPGGSFAVRTAVALHRLGANDSARDAVFARLKDEDLFVRNEAAIALRQFGPSSDVIAALLHVVETDPVTLVRHQAANSVLNLAGKRDLGADDPILASITAPDPREWKRAASELRRLFEDRRRKG